MKSKSTKAKVGLAVAVAVAGLVAIAANFGILSAHRSSPEVGVLTATDVADTSVAVPDTTPDPASTIADTTAEPVYQVRRDHDGDEHSDDDKHHDDKDSHTDKRRHDKGSDADD